MTPVAGSTATSAATPTTTRPRWSPAARSRRRRWPAATAPSAATARCTSSGSTSNARGAGQLPGRAAVIDQPFGSGRALLIGVNPFYRAWIDGEERLVGNGILYPTSAPVAPAAPPKRVAAAAEPAAAPIADGEAAGGQGRGPTRVGRNTIRDVRITVKRWPVGDAEDRRQAGAALEVAAREGALHAHEDDDDARHAQRPQRRSARPQGLGRPDHGRPRQAQDPRPLGAGLDAASSGGRAGAPPALPASCAALSAGGLVWSGPSGRSAGVALRGVREGCRPLGHAHRKPVRVRCARVLDRRMRAACEPSRRSCRPVTYLAR